MVCISLCFLMYGVKIMNVMDCTHACYMTDTRDYCVLATLFCVAAQSKFVASGISMLFPPQATDGGPPNMHAFY